MLARIALLPLVACLALPAHAEFRDIEGKAGYAEKTALPEGSTLEVQLLEIGSDDTPKPISSISIRTRGASPFPFRLVFDDAMIDRSRRYALAARIYNGEQALFQTAEASPMFTGIETGPPEIMLIRAEPPGGPPQPELTRSEWVLSEMASGQMAPASPAELNFRDEAQLTGSGGCNDFSTDFRIDPPKGLSFGKIARTLRGCTAETAQQERLVFRALAKTRAYAIEGSELVLFDEGEKPLLKFQQKR